MRKVMQILNNPMTMIKIRRKRHLGKMQEISKLLNPTQGILNKLKSQLQKRKNEV
jgi:hypothetical protein